MNALEPGEFDGTDRYLVQGRLGAGGYGVVYRAIDRERNIPVALKTLRNVAAKSLVRFKQEFRALADVSHPNLVTLYELSSHEQQWFFTMELVDGVNFLWYVRGETEAGEAGLTSGISEVTSAGLRAWFEQAPGGAGAVSAPRAVTLNLDRLRPMLTQLTEGVVALHAAGKLHRDIKPSNVLITRAGRLVLLDFGLVTEIAPSLTHTLDAVGTPAYMSPEQIAGLPLTQASDWYNVGSMLYQALTGQLPFAGSILDVMNRKQESEPPPPREVSRDVPADLDVLCENLLRRDPSQRPSGMAVLAALKGVSGGRPAASVLPAAGAAPFVGRERQLEGLRDAFQKMKTGRAVTVAVHGGSGMGKSALVRRFLDELKSVEGEAVVLAGRCYERESVPYKALDALIDALSRYLRRLPPAQVEAFLPHDILALARVFPVLRQVGAVARARRAVLEIPDSFELRRRAFAALRDLLVRVADRRPLVLFIDDLQWGDVDSAALLEDLLRPPDPPALLLIGCYRSEEAETSPLLKMILPKRQADRSLEMRDILVDELSASEADDLARELVGGEPLGTRRVEAIARESRGNPYFIEELVRFSQTGGPDIASDVTFEHVIRSRVAGLTPAARRLLDVVVVSGAPIEVGVAYRAADLEREGESVLAVLRASHLVRARSTLGRSEIETYHDRIRDAVSTGLPAESLEELHHRLASALLATGGADPETLARHYLAAGDAESAAEYAAAAAGKASEALAFDRAASLYRFALNLPIGTAPERAKLEVLLGDALANAGRGAEAAQVYLAAAERATGGLGIELHRRAAQQLYTSGYIAEAERALEGVLAKLGLRLPKTPRTALLSLLIRRFQVRFRFRGLRFQERDETEIPAQVLLRIDTCWAVGVGLGIVDMVRGADFQARHLVLALRAGEPYRIARALAMEGAYVSMGGNRTRKRTRRLLEAAHALAKRVHQPYAAGLATMAEGNAAMLDGRWRDARRLCEEAEQILRNQCAGVDWEILIAQLCGLASTFLLGEVGAFSQRLRSLLGDAEGRGSRLRAAFLRTGFCSHVAWLAADDADRARQELETGLQGWRQSDRFDYLRLWVRGARTDIVLYSGERLTVSEAVGKELRASARALERFIQMGFIRGIDSRARRRLAMAAQATSPADRDELLRGVERHAGAITRERTHWGDPLALLLRAGVAATRGQTAQAVPLLESAEAGLAAADMALHATAARRRRGELIGGETGLALVAAADAWMAGQGIKSPERMAAMLAPGRWRSSV